MNHELNRPDDLRDVAGGHEDSPGSRQARHMTSDILEVFGSQPLVQTPTEEPMHSQPPVEASTHTPTRPTSAGEPQATTRSQPPLVPPTETAIAWSAHGLDDPLATVDEEQAPRRGSAGSAEQAAAPAIDQQTVDTLLTTLRAVRDGQAHLAGVVNGSEQRIGAVEQKLDALTQQTAFLPPKLRNLGQRLNELNSSLSDQRTRDLLKDVLDLGDLVEAALESLPEEIEAASPLAGAQRLFQAMDTRFRQILETQGAVEIETRCEFDPGVHQAVESQPVYEADASGQIVEVFRRGYRTEHLVLRYAEVAVGRFVERRAENGQALHPHASLAVPSLTPGPQDRRAQVDPENSPVSTEPSPKPDADKSDG